MPTHEELPRFLRDWQRLQPAQRNAFQQAPQLFGAGLTGQAFAPKLRVKRVQGGAGVWEMSWAADGRARFSYGPELISGQPHIVWRRIGTHEIFRRP